MPVSALGDYKDALNAIHAIIDLMARELVGEMSLNQLRVLVEVMQRVASGQRAEMGDIGASLKSSRGTLSRLVATLTAEGYAGRPGLGLINRVEDAADRRKKTLELTERGQELCAVLGSSLRRIALSHLDRIVELTAANPERTVRAGIDTAFGVCVYQVSGACVPATYRQIIVGMNEWPDYRFTYSEVIDLTEAQTFELDDAGVRAAIALMKSLDGSSRQWVVITSDPAALSKLQEIEARFRHEDLSGFSVVPSLTEAKAFLKLPSGWQYPETSLLNI